MTARKIPIRATALFVLLAALPAPAVVAPLVDCPPASFGGDAFGDQHFYVTSLPGSTLQDVTLWLQFPASGTYTLSSTARQDAFNGTLLGTATETVTVGSDTVLPVVFHFNGVAVTPNAIVTFEQKVVSNPAGSPIFFGVLTRGGCPAVETGGTAPPLGVWWRTGIPVTITGKPANARKTVTIPAVASIHGAGGTFFHSDVSLMELFAQNLTVTATYHCYAGQNCGTQTATLDLASYTQKSLPDIVANLFHAPETAGAVVFTYTGPYGLDSLYATSRVYTPSLPAPTNGALVPGFPATSATGSSAFLGLGNNGASRSAGFRTNAGAYNPMPYATSVKFWLYKNNGQEIGSGSLLGTYTATWGPNEARQVNDVFAACGAGSYVGTDALLVVTSTLPVFSYVTVVDNVTGDSVVQGPTDF